MSFVQIFSQYSISFSYTLSLPHPMSFCTHLILTSYAIFESYIIRDSCIYVILRSMLFSFSLLFSCLAILSFCYSAFFVKPLPFLVCFLFCPPRPSCFSSFPLSFTVIPDFLYRHSRLPLPSFPTSFTVIPAKAGI